MTGTEFESSGVVGVVEADSVGAILRRTWLGGFRANNDEGRLALDLAAASIERIRQCQEAFFALTAAFANRARQAWDADREAEAATLAARLSRKPELISRKLQTTYHGVALLIALWNRLARALEDRGSLDEVESSTALDLLGVPRIFRAGTNDLTPPDGVELRVHLAEVIAEETTRLEELEAALIPLDDMNRADAERGIGVMLTRECRTIFADESRASTRLKAALKAIDRHCTPVPTAEPAPVPAPIAAAPAPVEPKKPEPARTPIATEVRVDRPTQAVPAPISQAAPESMARRKRPDPAVLQRLVGRS